ncbi:MAG: DUF3179 domain-containing (seleno)protein, partial [Isosphaeraceae bacterium]
DPTPGSLWTLPQRTQNLISQVSKALTPEPRLGPFPPFVDVPVVTATSAGADVRDEHYVVGVQINGESRAYPLNMICRPDHHIVNDTLGGVPIAVTFCSLCQAPLVYRRQVDGQTLTFFVSGYLYIENMMIQDVETGSEWPQMMGEAVEGPLKGKSLDPVPWTWTDWKSWRTSHPETTLLKIPQTVEYYGHDVVASGSSLEKRYFSNLQWGFERGGKSLSWPLAELARLGAVNDSFSGLPLVIVYESRSATIAAFDRRVAGAELTFRLEAEGLIDDQTSSVWDPVSGQAIRGPRAGQRLAPVAGVVSHNRAWRELHPESEIRTAPRTAPGGARPSRERPTAKAGQGPPVGRAP